MRRAIILLSDGEDNQSHVTREEAIEMAQRAEAIVYTISTNVSGTKGKGDKVLERIADATGGRAFFPFQIRDVANAFAEIQEELRSQYAVSYKPGGSQGGRPLPHDRNRCQRPEELPRPRPPRMVLTHTIERNSRSTAPEERPTACRDIQERHFRRSWGSSPVFVCGSWISLPRCAPN